MDSSRGCALIATAFPAEGEGLEALLKEIGFSEITHARDGISALRLVQERRYGVLVADAVLPGLDGVELFRRVRNAPMQMYPSGILLTLPGLSVRGGAEECAVLEKPVNRDALASALEMLRPERRLLPAGKRAKAEALLDSVGIPEHCGREYLLRAVGMAWQDSRLNRSLTTGIYPAVAEAFGVDGRRVERAIRHVIDVAWRGGEIEAQYELFGDTIDAKRGCPTCGEMIARIADILRWEGKA